MTQEELVEACKIGDKSAQAELYTLYSKKMLRICQRYVTDQSAAEDIMHDGFVIIFTSLHTLRTSDKLEYWMGSIMRNLALYHLNRHKQIEMIGIGELSDNELLCEDVEYTPSLSYAEIASVIDKLPDGYRNVFKLAVLENLSHQQIAAVLGIEPHSSSSQLSRAKRMLRSLLRQRGLIVFIIGLGCMLVVFLQTKTDRPQKEKSGHSNFITEKAPSQEYKRKKQKTIRHDKVSLPPILPKKTDVSINQPPQQSLTLNDTVNSTKTASTPNKQVQTFTKTAISPSVTNRLKKKDKTWTILFESSGSWGKSSQQTGSPDGSVISGEEETETTEHHNPPLSFSFRITKTLNKNWSFSTGLGYTYLKADFFQKGTLTSYRQQHIHWLDIPIQFSRIVYRQKPFAFYLAGNLKLHIPVHASSRQQILDSSGTYNENPVALHPSLELSVGTSIGFQYQISPHIHFFIEPAINYYIPNNNQIRILWQKRPLSVSIPVGIQYSW